MIETIGKLVRVVLALVKLRAPKPGPEVDTIPPPPPRR